MGKLSVENFSPVLSSVFGISAVVSSVFIGLDVVFVSSLLATKADLEP